jgi:beta-N-acetylglucosaminidase
MPHGCDRTILFVICHSCSSIVGAIDDFKDQSENQEINLQFQVLNKKLETVNNNIGQLMNGLKLLYNKLDAIKKSEE